MEVALCSLSVMLDICTRKPFYCLIFFFFDALQAVFETRLRELSIALPLMCCAADMLSVPSRKQVVLVGQKGSAEFQDMVAAVFSTYDPNRTVSEDCSAAIFNVWFCIMIVACCCTCFFWT
jgi:hypothetical protein